MSLCYISFAITLLYVHSIYNLLSPCYCLIILASLLQRTNAGAGNDAEAKRAVNSGVAIGAGVAAGIAAGPAAGVAAGAVVKGAQVAIENSTGK